MLSIYIYKHTFVNVFYILHNYITFNESLYITYMNKIKNVDLFIYNSHAFHCQLYWSFICKTYVLGIGDTKIVRKGSNYGYFRCTVVPSPVIHPRKEPYPVNGVVFAEINLEPRVYTWIGPWEEEVYFVRCNPIVGCHVTTVNQRFYVLEFELHFRNKIRSISCQNISFWNGLRKNVPHL